MNYTVGYNTLEEDFLNDWINIKGFKTYRDYEVKINEKPKETEILLLTYSKKDKPIQFIPYKRGIELLEYFFPAYNVEVVGSVRKEINSMVCSVNLSVYHPFKKIWLTYGGVGAEIIETNNKGGATVDAVKKNAPCAKSLAISNAMKMISVRFGRGLNDFSDE